ncbi:hypothetical protein GE061_019524 [Apolygus lucorum]|uniref:Uncharacterized protein n=1 Tax=Apolygus lucorum TaxID=248454 RepID=A0A6A4JV05_APOLU|nr:hypothetical protein GE061_019524 [Apolygus lucorum]
MRVDGSEKFFWLVFLELFFGFVPSIAFIGHGGQSFYYRKKHGYLKDLQNDLYDHLNEALGSDSRSRNSERALLMTSDLLIHGAFIPVILRFQIYAYNKRLTKCIMLNIIVIACVMYICGGIFLLLESKESRGMVIKGGFAVTAGIILFIDSICFCFK